MTDAQDARLRDILARLTDMQRRAQAHLLSNPGIAEQCLVATAFILDDLQSVVDGEQ